MVIDLGYVVGVVFDVFLEELVKNNVLFGMDNFIVMFYLGVVMIEV